MSSIKYYSNSRESNILAKKLNDRVMLGQYNTTTNDNVDDDKNKNMYTYLYTHYLCANIPDVICIIVLLFRN